MIKKHFIRKYEMFRGKRKWKTVYETEFNEIAQSYYVDALRDFCNQPQRVGDMIALMVEEIKGNEKGVVGNFKTLNYYKIDTIERRLDYKGEWDTYYNGNKIKE